MGSSSIIPTNRIELAVLFIHGYYSSESSVYQLKDLSNLTTLDVHRNISRLSLFDNFCYDMPSFRLSHCKPPSYISPRHDHSANIEPLFGRTNRFNSPHPVMPFNKWNVLPIHIVVDANVFGKKYSALYVRPNLCLSSVCLCSFWKRSRSCYFLREWCHVYFC